MHQRGIDALSVALALSARRYKDKFGRIKFYDNSTRTVVSVKGQTIVIVYRAKKRYIREVLSGANS